MGRRTNLHEASHQWATRPADERFWNLKEMIEAQNTMRRQSVEIQLPIADMKFSALGDDGGDLCLDTDSGPISFTNWSFNQLCGAAKAPADFLRRLPTDLAAQVLTHGLNSRHDVESGEFQALIRLGDNEHELRALTSSLTRVWNYDCVGMLEQLQPHGWMVPPARPAVDDPRARKATKADIVPNQDNFGLSIKVGDMIAPAGLYASDRDMFAFMVNPDRIVDEKGKGMMRGFFLSNSEVGGGSLCFHAFLLENVCGNHICWGAETLINVRKTHRGTQILQVNSEMFQHLREFANRPASNEGKMIAKARAYVIGKDKEEVVEATLHASDFRKTAHGLTKSDIEKAYTAGIKYEHTALSPPTSLWGIIHGLTRVSQEYANTNDRNRVDEGAGRLLQLVSGK